MSDLNLVIEGVENEPEYGELGTFEVKCRQEDGSDLFVLYSRVADSVLVIIDKTSHIRFFNDEEFDEDAYKKALDNALEDYDFVIGDKESYGNIRNSKYYKAINFVASFYDSLDWPSTEDEIEEAFKPYIGKNIDDFEDTGSLDNLLR